MKKIATFKIFLICVITLSYPFIRISNAQNTYYVSSSIGDDSYDGLAPAWNGTNGPWQTISKVNSTGFSAGDQILFKKGDAWNEQLVFSSSGTSSMSITFGSYGSGDSPLINSADTISGWTLYNGANNVWVASVSSTITNISQIFVDGGRYTLARWPNTGWNAIDSTSTSGRYLYDDNLSQADNYWAGCTAVWRYKWTFATATITSSTSSTSKIYFNTTSYIPTKEYGYYIEGKFEQLDTAGEYYFDSSNHLLYVALPTGEIPSGHIIEASVRNYGIYASSKSYVSVSGINIKNAASSGIRLVSCNYANILDCTIGNSKIAGIYCNATNGTDLNIEGNTVDEVDGGSGIAYGIYVHSIANTDVTNNVVSNISTDTISPRRGIGIYFSTGVNNSTITGNTISDISNDGIMLSAYSGPSITVSHNNLYNCVCLLADAGGIYVNGNKTETIVEHNFLSGFKGSKTGAPSNYSIITVGIYFDAGSYGGLIQGNIVDECTRGVHLNQCHSVHVFNNTFYNNKTTSISLQEGSQNQMYGHVIKNNLCYGMGTGQLSLYIRRYPTSTNAIGEFDYNLYYNPYRSNAIKYYDGTDYTYTFAEWQAKTGLDAGNDANSLASSPLLEDAANDDFHLTSSSPCIDSGVDVDLSEDFDGVTIPQGDDPDIGAYEYVLSNKSATNISKKDLNFGLHIFPNPFSRQTNIKYILDEAGKVNLSVYNVNGQKTMTLFEGNCHSGGYSSQWDATGYLPGIYFIKMEVDGNAISKKVCLVKSGN